MHCVQAAEEKVIYNCNLNYLLISFILAFLGQCLTIITVNTVLCKRCIAATRIQETDSKSLPSD